MINVYETGVLFTSIGLGICTPPLACLVFYGNLSAGGWYFLALGGLIATYSSCLLVIETLELRKKGRTSTDALEADQVSSEEDVR
jgi:hypothetical protein